MISPIPVGSHHWCHSLIVAIGGLALLTGFSGRTHADTLIWKNGDRLKGKLIAIDPKGGRLRWHP
ncbi:MAG: hypothetical protein AAF514_23605, partial [Verrucomicrobiota bacterium]